MIFFASNQIKTKKNRSILRFLFYSDLLIFIIVVMILNGLKMKKKHKFIDINQMYVKRSFINDDGTNSFIHFFLLF